MGIMTMSSNFEIGELVEVRDANNKTWRAGIITQLEPKLLVQCGYGGWCPLAFDHIRKCASKPPTHKKPLVAPPKPEKQPISTPAEPKQAAPPAKPQSQNLLYYNP